MSISPAQTLKKLSLVALLFVFCVQASVASAFAAARFELSPTSGQIQTSGTTVIIKVDADGNQLKSASAVLTFDATKVTVTSVDGTYFPTVTTDTTTAGELVISGTLPIGNTEGVAGTGTLATLTIKPVSGATGSPTVTFRCSESSSNDSNIINLSGTNLLSTTAQCANNVPGSYTLGSGSTGGTTEPPAGSVQCNLTCSATRDCATGLSCVSGKCRNSTCSTTTNCSCAGADIAGAQGATTLPQSGSLNEMATLLVTGTFFLASGAALIWYKRVGERVEGTTD
jgi:hypothetical protein